MADRPTARDDERLPWLDSVEGDRARRRGPVSRTALVGLLVAFFGIGLAVAFSLGYRVARPAAVAPVAKRVEQPQRSASVQVPQAPPVSAPKVEAVAPEPVIVETPVVEPKPIATARPAIKKAVRRKAHVRHVRHRKPILRPFINIKKRAPAAPVAQPVRLQPATPFTPKGRIIQLGAYSTQRQADAAYRSIVWRYPYLAAKPKVVSPTQPVGGWKYYRLRLGTENQAQSLVICQYLHARGQSCIVIY